MVAYECVISAVILRSVVHAMKNKIRGWIITVCVLVVVVVVVGLAFVWQPGKPPAGLADRTTFDISFRSALYAGLLSGLLTGLVVGLVVWWVQDHTNRRREEGSIARDVEVLRNQMRVALLDVDDIDVGPSPVSMAWVSSRAAAELASTVPAHQWAGRLPSAQPFLEAVNAHRTTFLRFKGAANGVFWPAERVIERVTHDPRIASADIPKIRAYSLARLAGATIEELRVGIVMNEENTVRQWEDIYQQITTDPVVADAMREFASVQERLKETTRVLRKHVEENR